MLAIKSSKFTPFPGVRLRPLNSNGGISIASPAAGAVFHVDKDEVFVFKSAVLVELERGGFAGYVEQFDVVEDPSDTAEMCREYPARKRRFDTCAHCVANRNFLQETGAKGSQRTFTVHSHSIFRAFINSPSRAQLCR